MLGTPSRDEIQQMNPNYTEFRFPMIRAHPWSRVFRARTPADAIDLVSKLLKYTPNSRLRCQQTVGIGNPFPSFAAHSKRLPMNFSMSCGRRLANCPPPTQCRPSSTSPMPNSGAWIHCSRRRFLHMKNYVNSTFFQLLPKHAQQGGEPSELEDATEEVGFNKY